jgi:predicted RNase H-like HicB family nuclease
MKFHTFEIVVEKEAADDGCLAYSPTLPGCLSNGKTEVAPVDWTASPLP